MAVNLAMSLNKLGYKVGLLDADIYGPSLPALLNKEGVQLRSPADDPQLILPVEYNGVKFMSYGFVAPNRRAVFRGPIISSVINQLSSNTVWDDLDYLLIDMPPGTGDIQITLCQEMEITAAVIVTSPQRLSFIDVVKGIEMFDELNVPTVSVIQNFAYYKCP